MCGGGLVPPTQEVGCVWNVIVCLLVGCAVLLALFVDFRWVSGGWLKFLGELDSLRNSVLLPWPRFWSTEMHTSVSSCHIPAAEVRVVGYLMDVFHVVYKAPPPISLVLPLKYAYLNYLYCTSIYN